MSGAHAGSLRVGLRRKRANPSPQGAGVPTDSNPSPQGRVDAGA